MIARDGKPKLLTCKRKREPLRKFCVEVERAEDVSKLLKLFANNKNAAGGSIMRQDGHFTPLVPEKWSSR